MYNFNFDFLYPPLDKINKEKNILILMGDFNINLLNSDKSVSNFLDIFCNKGDHFLKNLIDNIFFDSLNSKTSQGT